MCSSSGRIQVNESGACHQWFSTNNSDRVATIVRRKTSVYLNQAIAAFSLRDHNAKKVKIFDELNCVKIKRGFQPPC